MSHDATNWAIKQRGLKPALKVVLWHLCDRYNRDNGCFPSQETLAADCEVPRSTLNVYLKELEEAGLIAREQRRERRSNRQERTRYRFPFEPDFPAGPHEKSTKNPCPETGHGEAKAESRNGAEPSPDSGESRVQNLDSNPVREPGREPVISREGTRARSEEDRQEPEDPKKIETAFWRVIKAWPGFDGMPKKNWKRAWFDLTADERERAEAKRDAWLARLKAQKKSHTPSPSTYFEEKLFDDIPDVVAPPSGGKPLASRSENWAATFSPPHSAAYFRILLAGPDKPECAPSGEIWLAAHLQTAWPRLFHFWQQSQLKGGLIVSPTSRSLGELMQFVPADTDTMSEWRRFFRDRHLPEPKVMATGAYFPKGGPDGLDEFERAARSIIEARNEDDAA